MEALANIAVIVGVASVGLLWTFSLAGAVATVWETLSDHIDTLVSQIKG
jgi:hypothetical protein